MKEENHENKFSRLIMRKFWSSASVQNRSFEVFFLGEIALLEGERLWDELAGLLSV